MASCPQRGIIYSILMVLGKLLVGAVLLSWDLAASHAKHHTARNTISINDNNHSTSTSPVPKHDHVYSDKQDYYHDADGIELGSVAEDEDTDTASSPSPSRSPSTSEAEAKASSSSSFLAASFIGLAMVARGEIGILIAQVAYK